MVNSIRRPTPYRPVGPHGVASSSASTSSQAPASGTPSGPGSSRVHKPVPIRVPRPPRPHVSLHTNLGQRTQPTGPAAMAAGIPKGPSRAEEAPPRAFVKSEARPNQSFPQPIPPKMEWYPPRSLGPSGSDTYRPPPIRPPPVTPYARIVAPRSLSGTDVRATPTGPRSTTAITLPPPPPPLSSSSSRLAPGGDARATPTGPRSASTAKVPPPPNGPSIPKYKQEIKNEWKIPKLEPGLVPPSVLALSAQPGPTIPSRPTEDQRVRHPESNPPIPSGPQSHRRDPPLPSNPKPTLPPPVATNNQASTDDNIPRRPRSSIGRVSPEPARAPLRPELEPSASTASGSSLTMNQPTGPIESQQNSLHPRRPFSARTPSISHSVSPSATPSPIPAPPVVPTTNRLDVPSSAHEIPVPLSEPNIDIVDEDALDRLRLARLEAEAKALQERIRLRQEREANEARNRANSNMPGDDSKRTEAKVRIGCVPTDAREFEIRRFIASMGSPIIHLVHRASSNSYIATFRTFYEAANIIRVLSLEDFRPGHRLSLTPLDDSTQRSPSPTVPSSLPLTSTTDIREFVQSSVVEPSVPSSVDQTLPPVQPHISLSSDSRSPSLNPLNFPILPSSPPVEIVMPQIDHIRKGTPERVIETSSDDVIDLTRNSSISPLSSRVYPEIEGEIEEVREKSEESTPQKKRRMEEDAVIEAEKHLVVEVDRQKRSKSLSEEPAKRTKEVVQAREKGKGKERERSREPPVASSSRSAPILPAASSVTNSQRPPVNGASKKLELHVLDKTNLQLKRPSSQRTRWIASGEGMWIHGFTKGLFNIFDRDTRLPVGDPVQLSFPEGHIVENYIIAGRRVIVGHRHPKIEEFAPPGIRPVQISYIELPSSRSQFKGHHPTGHITLSPHHALGLSSLAALPSNALKSGDGPRTSAFITGGFDHYVRIWKLDEDRKSSSWAIHQGHSAGVNALAYHQYKKQILSGGADGRVLVWDANSTKLGSWELPKGGDPVTQLHLSTDPNLLTVEFRRAKPLYRVFDLRTDKTPVLSIEETEETIAKGTTKFTRGFFSTNLMFFAKGTSQGTVKLWDLRRLDLESTANSIVQLQPKGTEIRQVLFEDDGNLLLDLTKETLCARKFSF